MTCRMGPQGGKGNSWPFPSRGNSVRPVLGWVGWGQEIHHCPSSTELGRCTSRAQDTHGWRGWPHWHLPFQVPEESAQNNLLMNDTSQTHPAVLEKTPFLMVNFMYSFLELLKNGGWEEEINDVNSHHEHCSSEPVRATHHTGYKLRLWQTAWCGQCWRQLRGCTPS